LRRTVVVVAVLGVMSVLLIESLRHSPKPEIYPTGVDPLKVRYCSLLGPLLPQATILDSEIRPWPCTVPPTA
jgi:hypothetical protein